MLSKETIKLLQQQVNKEFYSAYLYLHFVNYLEKEGLSGFANWYRIQAQEERDHALFFIDFLQANDVLVEFEAIAKPDLKIESVGQVLKEGLAHERYISDSIHTIYNQALKDNDFRTTQFLDWFVKEQMEEEVNAQDLIDKHNLVKESGYGIYQLDKELATRVYTAPTFVVL